MDSWLSSLLGRWHQWRSHYSHERGFSRVRFMALADGDQDEEFEQMEMRGLEESISELPQLQQLALQHMARAECLGVEVIHLNRLPRDPGELDKLCGEALAALSKKLLAAGLL